MHRRRSGDDSPRNGPCALADLHSQDAAAIARPRLPFGASPRARQGMDERAGDPAVRSRVPRLLSVVPCPPAAGRASDRARGPDAARFGDAAGMSARAGVGALPVARDGRLAKLTCPRLFSSVPRERLFGLLDARRAHPVVWISGPPGAGKTILAASYLISRRLPGVWYRLDAGDADPAVFFHYLGLAAAGALGSRPEPWPLLAPDGQCDLAGFSRRFFRLLCARLPRPAIVVLDEYQEVLDQPAFHALLAQAAREIPDGINLVIAGRTAPPGAYARLLASELVGRVDWPELRLTLEETHAITCAAHSLDDAIVRALHRECGGWAAGLTLMLERIYRASAARDAAAASRAALPEYFAAEILGKISPEARQLLLATAHLPRVSAAAAAKLSGRPHAGRLLDELHHRGLFTERCAGSPASYRYFAPFRQFLRARAAEANGGVARPTSARRTAPEAAPDRDADRTIDVAAPRWPISIFTLGGFKVLVDGAELRFARKAQKRPLELLQALIALGGSDVPMGSVAGAVWPDADGDAAYHACENTLYRLRRLLHSRTAVRLAGGRLSLDASGCWVDAWALERCLDRARAADSASSGELASALDLYRGHFLGQDERSWALPMRERLREKMLRALRCAAQDHERAGAWSAAAADYRRGLELDPLAEDFYRGLMICHRELGDRAEPIRVYRRCRELLSIVLGVQPAALTQAVYRSLADGERRSAGGA